MKRPLILLFLLILPTYYLLPTTYCFAEDKIVAVVNNDIITQKDLNDFINFMRIQLSQQYSGLELESKIQSMKLDLIKRLIEDKLILQEAKRLGISVDENRVIGRINEIKRGYSSDEEFQKALKRQGLVQADVENKIRDQFLMFNVVEYKIRSKVSVNPTEVTNYYQNNLSQFKLGEQREFESISVNSKDTADEAYAALQQGELFQDVAMRHYLPVNKLTVAQDKQLKGEIEDIIFKLGKDEFSQPVEIDHNYYIFRLADVIPAHQQNLAEVRDRIYTYLFNKKMEEEMSLWVDDLKKHSYIKISEGI